MLESLLFFLLTVVSKPEDCIFPYAFSEDIKKKVNNSLLIPFNYEACIWLFIFIRLEREKEYGVDY